MSEELMDPADDLDELDGQQAMSDSAGGDETGEDDDIDFSWTDEAGEDAGEESGAGEDEAEEVETYEFSLGEDTQIPAEIHGELGAVAKELGLPGDKAALLLNKALGVWNEAHERNNKELGRALRKEWGQDFKARVKATQAFAARLGREAGLKAEDMQVMMSPYGIRLLDAMRQRMSEGGFAGRAQTAPRLTVQQQLDAFYANKDKMAAVLNPSHPMHDTANAELNRLHGID